jgi:cholesterol oxidase
VKNYLYFAEKWGALVRPETEVRDIRPLPGGQPDGARYEIVYRSSTARLRRKELRARARSVVVSAGVMGTLKLLFRCRDVTGSLHRLSPRLGDTVRTNSEALLGVVSRSGSVDYSQGVAITSIFNADPVTRIEPVRYPAGSSLMRFLAGPLIEAGNSVAARVLKFIWQAIRHPVDFARLMILPGWAKRTTIMLVMQTEDNHMQVRLGRGLLTLWRRGLVSKVNAGAALTSAVPISHKVTKTFATKTGGVAAGSISESLLNVPMTAHILGGCSFGLTADEGVINLDCQVFNYPGLYVVDNSIVPANPGVNPSLTTTALAEYAMSCIPPKDAEQQVRVSTISMPGK